MNLNLYASNQENIDVYPILQRLLIHLSNSINDLRFQGVQNMFIIKKLLSNLSLVFNSYDLKDPEWIDPLKSLAFILSSNLPPTVDQLNSDVSLIDIIQIANQDKTPIKLLLSLSSIIVEDMMKISKDATKDRIHSLIHSNVFEITKELLTFTFESKDPELKLIGLECVHSWIFYISFTQNNTTVRYKNLECLLKYLIEFLRDSEDEIFEKSVEILTDIFENDPLLMNYELREQFNNLLQSQWSLAKINEIVGNEDFDLLTNLTSLIISFLQIDAMQLTSNLMQNRNNEFLKFLLNLTNFPAVPILQENVSLKFIQFWCEIIEIFTDDMDVLENSLKNDPILINEVNKNFTVLLQELSMIYFNKIQLTITSDSQFKQHEREFFSFRGDTVEVFEMIYSKLGISLFETLISSIPNNSNVNQIESSLFILGALAMNFTPDDVDQKAINCVELLFQESFLFEYNQLTSKLPSSLSNHYVKTSIRFLGSLEFFYKQSKVDYLNSVIDYLFTCLKDHPQHENMISRTIMDLCDNCRSQLVSSIPNFEPILVEMIKNPSISTYTREKFINSVSCIIQSLHDPNTQENHVYHIVELIKSTCEPLIPKATQNTLEENEKEYLISLFSSLYELGKGLSLPDDFDEDNPELYSKFQSFYQSSNKRIQEKLVGLVTVFAIEISSLSQNLEVNEKACLIFKIGLLEDFGPFAFTNDVVLQFALRKSSQQNSIPIMSHILELLTTLINTGLHSKASSSNILSQSDISNIVQYFIVQKYQFISEDPDLLQLSLNLLTQVLLHKPAYLLHEESSITFAIQTGMSLLYSHEKFVIKAASKFWTTFLSARKTTKEDSLMIQQLVESEIGQTLTFKVFESLIEAARSDVDTYSSILIVLFAKYQLKFKDWCRNALIQIDEQRQVRGKRPIQDRELFVKKLVVTRASTRKCNELIKDFWITTNGLISFTK